MPITLGCPSCGKRFRAREESSGKKVKCPFCQSAVSVPSSDEFQKASAPTDEFPRLGDVSAPPVAEHPLTAPAPALPVEAASPDAWGTEPQEKPIGLIDHPPKPSVPLPAAASPLTMPPPLSVPSASTRPRKAEKSPEEQSVAAWKKSRGGLFWVRFAFLWFGLIAALPVAKFVYERTQGALPKGDGADWIKIDDVVNTPTPNTIHLAKEDIIQLVAYGVPVLIGGLMLSFGRVTAGAAPRNSGAKGLFLFSGLATLLALSGLATWLVCERVAFRETARYGLWAFKIGGTLGEFWFLLALAGAGATLRRPASVRAVGLFSLVVGIAVAIYFVGWDAYVEHLGPRIHRPDTVEPGSDWQFYESIAVLLGWLILIGTYWRAVGSVRAAIREHVRE